MHTSKLFTVAYIIFILVILLLTFFALELNYIHDGAMTRLEKHQCRFIYNNDQCMVTIVNNETISCIYNSFSRCPTKDQICYLNPDSMCPCIDLCRPPYNEKEISKINFILGKIICLFPIFLFYMYMVYQYLY